jgi:hypothetical protein
LDKHAMDVDTAEALAGVVRLLRQAALPAWAATDRAGARYPGQLFAFGVDLAADQARHLVPDGTDIDGPVPVGSEPADLLRSTEQVWAVSWPDSYHLDLVVAVLWHAGSGGWRGNSSNDSAGQWL